MSNIKKDKALINTLNKKYKDKKVPYMGNIDLPSDKSQFEYDKDRIEVIRRCKEDILYFAENFFYIINPDEGKQKITLHDFQKESLITFKDHRKSIMCCARQIGKALALDTPIPTPNGWTTMGELKVGDTIYDENGNLCNVTKAWDIMYDRPCYEITFDNGEKIVADEEHLWLTCDTKDRKRWAYQHSRGNMTRYIPENWTKDLKEKTTKEIYDTLKVRGSYNHCIPLVKQIERPIQDTPIDPYVFGYLLGDGDSTGSGRVACSEEDLEYLTTEFKLLGEDVNSDAYDNIHFYIKKLKSRWASMGLECNKHIPEIYENNSIDNRVKLIRGLIDSDGHVDKHGSYRLTNTNKEIIDGASRILSSLGIKNTIHVRVGRERNGNVCKDSYELIIRSTVRLSNLKRKYKKARHEWKVEQLVNYIRNVEKVESVPVRCISVDSPNNLFMCGRTYIPTHNSTVITIYALWLVTFFEYQRVVIVANKEKTAQYLLGRVQLAYKELPDWFKPPTSGWGKQGTEFANGSEIAISSTSSDAIRGMSVNCVTGDGIITVKDKKTGEIKDITIEELYLECKTSNDELIIEISD